MSDPLPPSPAPRSLVPAPEQGAPFCPPRLPSLTRAMLEPPMLMFWEGVGPWQPLSCPCTSSVACPHSWCICLQVSPCFTSVFGRISPYSLRSLVW